MLRSILESNYYESLALLRKMTHSKGVLTILKDIK